MMKPMVKVVKENPIETERWEMADIMAKHFHINGEGFDASDFEWTAHCLQQEGFGKKTEVAREIFEEIYEDCFDQFGYIDYKKLAELKKKYTEEKE